MRSLILVAALGTVLSADGKLATQYKAGTAVRVSVESTARFETTASEIERDGETQSGNVGAKSETHREEVHVDTVVAVEDGKPTKVRRHFTELGGTSLTEFGDNSRERELESTFSGITLELSADAEGHVDAKVVEGRDPEGEGALEGHRLELFLDGLLPSADVKEGASWDLESAAIVRALRMDMQAKLFAPPAREEGGGEGGRGRGRRGGGRGGSDSMLATSDWKGTAKLVSLDEEKNGVACAVIELQFETSGDREMEAFGGRGGRMFAPPAFANTMSWTAKLEGKLWIDKQAQRPVALEVEGSVKTETNMEMERQGSTMRMYTASSGKVEYAVTVEEAPVEEPKK